MYQTSGSFQEAVRNRERQIALLIFNSIIFSNEDIRVDKGIEFHDYFNLEEDLCVGQALSNTIRFTVYNDDRYLNNYGFGEFTATIGVRTSSSKYSTNAQTFMKVGGTEWTGYRTYPYVKRNGVAVSNQPNFPVVALAAYKGNVYAVGANARFVAYSEAGGSTEAVLNNFMRHKLAKWQNLGVYLANDNSYLRKWQNGIKEEYEFAPLGVFTAERPNAPDKIEIDFLCYDRMQKFDRDYEGKIKKEWKNSNSKPTLYYFYNDICNQAGISNSDRGDIPIPDYVIQTRPKEFDNTLTLRAVLEWIAEAAGTNVKFDRKGKLQFVWVGGAVARQYDESSYSSFDPYWYQTEQVGKVVTRSTENGKEIEEGVGVGYLVQDNPFLQVFQEKVASQASGAWSKEFEWDKNDIDEFDDEWYWSKERIEKEFGKTVECKRKYENEGVSPFNWDGIDFGEVQEGYVT